MWCERIILSFRTEASTGCCGVKNLLLKIHPLQNSKTKATDPSRSIASAQGDKTPFFYKLLLIGAGLWLVLLWPRPVFAHAGLVRSEPRDLCTALASPRVLPPATTCSQGSLLTEPPKSVHLWFSEPIQTVRHGLTVVAPSGQRVELGAIQNDGSELSIAVNAAEEGTYQINWQIISEDTHPVVGHFAFSIGHTSPVAQASDFAPQIGAVSSLGLVLQVAGRWLHFLGYALAFGPLVFNVWVLHPFLLAGLGMQVKIWRLCSFGILILLISEPLALLGQTSSLGPTQMFDPDTAGDILSSSFGRVLAQRLGAAVLLWVLLGSIRQGSAWANKIALGLGLALAVVDGQASHAVSSGPIIVGLTVNTIHLVAMGLWVGGLLTLLTVWPTTALANHRPALTKRFGRLAAVCLLWLVATGSIMSWLHLGQTTDLFNTDYGKAILVKLIAVLGAMGLAGYILLKPASKRPHWWRIEIVMLLVIIGLAGLLVSLPPPA